MWKRDTERTIQLKGYTWNQIETDDQRQRRVEALYLWPMLQDGVIKGIIIIINHQLCFSVVYSSTLEYDL